MIVAFAILHQSHEILSLHQLLGMFSKIFKSWNGWKGSGKKSSPFACLLKVGRLIQNCPLLFWQQLVKFWIVLICACWRLLWFRAVLWHACWRLVWVWTLLCCTCWRLHLVWFRSVIMVQFKSFVVTVFTNNWCILIKLCLSEKVKSQIFYMGCAIQVGNS